MARRRPGAMLGVARREVVAILGRGTRVSGKRVLLLVVAALISAVAALAIGILLFGDFGSTEGRILGTTALFAGYALLALPAAILRDQRRRLRLAAAVVSLAVAGAALAAAAVWLNDPPDALGRTIATATASLLAATQVSALAARQREHDSRAVRRLFTASSALALVVAAMFAVLIWAEVDREGYARVLGALAVLDVLLVALQPILARARPAGAARRLRVLVAPGETIELAVDAPDLATAVSKAVRAVEREGRSVRAVEIVPSLPSTERNGRPPRDREPMKAAP
jgi:hypothetical protein